MTMRLNLGRGLFTLSLLGIGLMLSGCPTIRSPSDYASGWIGSPMERYLVVVDRDHARDPKKEPSREDLMRTRYTTANGNTIYVSPEHFKRCNIHWEVNPAGIIVGYRFEEVTKGGCKW